MTTAKRLMVAALLALLTGCGGMSPERRHAELEWELRANMPAWSPQEWNAWEAELAAALNVPPPDPPMFASDDEEAADDN